MTSVTPEELECILATLKAARVKPPGVGRRSPFHYDIVELGPDAYLEELLDRSARSTYTITL